MENFARSLLQVETTQGLSKPNCDHKVRTRMKRSPRMKLFSPKTRTWIGQWNVRTLYEAGKVAQLAAEMRRYRLEILGVSEARWNQFGEAELATGELFIYSGKENKDDVHERGVGIMLSARAKKSLMEWEPIDDRIITARFDAKIQKITVIQCYAPTNNAEPNEKEEFYNKLQAVVEKAPNRDIIIIMGDLNAKVGRNNASIERIMGKEGLGDVNENGEELVDFCALNGLSIGGTLFPHKRVHKATWISPDGVTENQIDHILISQRWRTSLQDVRVKRGATVGSDHHLVVASLKIKLAARKPLAGTRRKFNVLKLRDPDIRKAFQIELQNRFEALFIPEEVDEEARNVNRDVGEQVQDADINVQWEKTKRVLVDTCGSVLGSMKRTRKEWLSDDTHRKIEERRKAKQSLNDARTRQGKREANRYYNEKNREVKKSCRRDKRKLIKGIAREAEDAAEKNDLRTLYMTTRKLSGIRCNQNRPVRSEDGTLLTKMEDQLQRWKRHFESVLNRPAPSQLPDPLPADNLLNINIGPITRGEIKTALTQLKNAKAPGVDNIPPEALKEGGPCTVEALHRILNLVWEKEEIPDDWKRGLLVKLTKKGDLSKCGNWRGIMLLSIPSKILTRVLLNRMKVAVDEVMRDEQAGFRKDRSCIDQIATLRIIVEQSIEWSSPLYLLFVDFEKAFDSLDRETMWKILRHYGIPDKIINVIKVQYRDFTCQVLHGGTMTVPIEVKTGVRQGCLLSPLLFLVVLDWVTKNAYESKRLGLQWTLTQRLEDLDYADDLCLLTHRLTDMRVKVEKLQEFGGQVGLTINIKKTKEMRIGVGGQEALELNGEAVERVSEFTYLGSVISETGGTDEDIAARIRKAQSTFSMLMPVWKEKSIRLRTKLRIFNTNVKTALLYGSETWRSTKQLTKKLQTFINKCLRKILNIRWPEVISNEDLWERTEQSRIEESIKRKKWKWIGHTLRKPGNNITRSALEWNPQGSRKRGRPKQSWRRSVHDELAKKNTTWIEAKRTANNRVRWRSMVDALCSPTGAKTA